MPDYTFHLTPSEVWSIQSDAATYVPEAFTSDGFVHCTNGESAVLDAGNRYYRSDIRPYVCLTIDLDLVTVPVRYDDADRVYPHVHGAIDRVAVLAVRHVVRDDRGHFVGLADPLEP